MRKILLCLCFVFAVGLLFSACGKDDKKQNPAPAPDDIQTSTDLRDGQKPIPQDEQSAIDSSSDLKNPTGDLEGKTFEIFELRFGNKYIDAYTTLGPEEVKNGAVYHLVFGIKDNDGNVMYKTIDAAGAEWTLEDNVAVTKDDKGFKVKDNFYAENGNVSVRVDIDYKGLSKTFNFVLKSTKQEAINNPDINAPLPNGFTIYQLCVNGEVVATESYAGGFGADDNANYDFTFKLKDGEGNITDKAIDAAGVTFEFESDNDAVSKTNKGFSISSQFYSDRDANIKVTISFRGLEQSFRFVLSTKNGPPQEPDLNPLAFLAGTYWKGGSRDHLKTHRFTENTYTLTDYIGWTVESGIDEVAEFHYSIYYNNNSDEPQLYITGSAGSFGYTIIELTEDTFTYNDGYGTVTLERIR